MENAISTPTDAVSTPALTAPAAPPAAPAPERRRPRARSTSTADAQRAFSTSMLISATRCLLTYVVLPFVAPLLGIAKDVGPGVGLGIGLVAVTSNCLTIRRFHRANHRWRWAYTGIAVCVIVGLGILMGRDIAELVG